MSGNTSITFGKKSVLIGGREYDYIEYDNYTTSWFWNSCPANQVGITISHEVAEQTFMAQSFNGNKDNGIKDLENQPVNSQSKFGYALGWYGSFINGAIKPILAYTIVPRPSSETKGDNIFISTGIQLNTPHNAIVEFDYNILDKKQITTKNKTSSMIGLIRFTNDQYSPFVKIIKDTTKNDSTKTSERLAFDLGLEFKQESESNFRYHVVYSTSSLKEAMETKEIKHSPRAILVGVKFDAAILK